MAKEIVVDQVLHGYRDGHELLASSLTVPREARRTLLSMSDLSGPGFVDGFDGYWTGYPVVAMAKYALARTWYAPEGNRPGCVWTHTLLVDFSDIPRLNSLRDLDVHFRRPKSVDRTKSYEKRLSVRVSTRVLAAEQIDETLARRLLGALYGGDAPVLMRGAEVSEYQGMIFALWSQQWPRLRRSFSFSTGSFSFRSLGSTPLDLQVVPEERWSRVRRADRVTESVERSAERGRAEESEKTDEWLLAAAADLREGGSPLRVYLRRYGADASGQRRSFRSLARSFIVREQIRRGQASFDALVSTVGEGFPDKGDALRLKRELFGSEVESSEADQIEVEEGTRVLAALRTAYESAFDFGMSVESRASELAELGSIHGATFFKSLLDSSLNEIGRRVLDRVVDGIDVQALDRLRESDSTLFERVLRARPNLFYQEDLWLAPGDLQRACVALAGQGDSYHVDVERLVSCALSAGSVVVADECFVRWGQQTVSSVLAWLDGPEGRRDALGQRWMGGLREHAEGVVAWLARDGRPSRPETLEVIPEIASNPPLALSTVSTETLRRWVNVLGVSDQAPHAETMAFLLAAGLSRDDGAACDLVVSSFPVVHEALLRNRLGWRPWSWLEPQLPSRDWFFALDWDKADKLRRALLTRFVRNDWAAGSLAAAAYSDESRDYLCRTAAGSADWNRLVRTALMDG